MADFPFALVGFDLDGTLLDTHRDLAAAVNHALGLAGRPALSDAAVRTMVGGGVARLLERALDATGGPADAAGTERLRTALVDYYAQHLAVHTRPFPGLEPALNALALRGVTLAVVTNKLEALAVSLLRQTGLAGRFATIIGGDTLGPGRGKPAPDLLHLMCERTGGGAGAEAGVGAGSARAAYVGDSSFDVDAARAAAMPCVVVGFGFHDRPPRALGADAVIDGFDALVPALELLESHGSPA